MPSGKFRSLLLAILGREMPEARTWRVDRNAIRAYTQFVRHNIEALNNNLQSKLTEG